MATLLDLTSQGDVATITDDAYLNRTLQLMNPQQLYELWERQHWQSQAIDLERDKEHWAELPDDDQRGAPLGAQLVLRRRGARDHAVLRPRDGLRGRAGGGVPHDPAGRRGAPHAVLRPLVPRGGRRGRRHPPAAGGVAGGRDRRVRRAVRRAAREDGRAADRGAGRHGREGRLRDHLPHGHRGHARPDRPALHARLLREERAAARVRRGLRQHRARRAPARGLRHVVPPAEVRARSATAFGCRRRSTSCCRSRRACWCRRATRSATTTSSSATPRRSRPSSPTARCRGG